MKFSVSSKTALVLARGARTPARVFLLASIVVVGAAPWAIDARATAAPGPQSADVPSLIQQAQQYVRDAQWQKAIDAWTKVLVRDPANQEAKDGLARAQAALDMGGTVDQVSKDLDVLRQKARVEFDASMQRAEEMRQRGDYTDAKNTLIGAKVKVNQNRAAWTQQFNRDIRV